ncbi:MAG: nucleoside-diphosphate kinase [bacterium]
MGKERTFVMIKPDGVQRGLVGEVIRRLERRGLRIAAIKMMHIEPELAERHYVEHRGKPFFDSLIDFVTSAPVVAMVVEGTAAVTLVRNMMGALKPEEALPGSIRGDFTTSKSYNIVHGSDSPENAEREISFFFKDNEIFSYHRKVECWLECET